MVYAFVRAACAIIEKSKLLSFSTKAPNENPVRTSNNEGEISSPIVFSNIEAEFE